MYGHSDPAGRFRPTCPFFPFLRVVPWHQGERCLAPGSLAFARVAHDGLASVPTSIHGSPPQGWTVPRARGLESGRKEEDADSRKTLPSSPPGPFLSYWLGGGSTGGACFCDSYMCPWGLPVLAQETQGHAAALPPTSSPLAPGCWDPAASRLPFSDGHCLTQPSLGALSWPVDLIFQLPSICILPYSVFLCRKMLRQSPSGCIS